MKVMDYLLSIDQGTSSTRVIVFDPQGHLKASAQRELTQHFPHEGWIEHDPEQIWQDTCDCAREALQKSNLSANTIRAIGISNQRETTIIWNRKTGKPVYPAIVWQDRRTADLCERLIQQGHEPMVHEKTGLMLDPYFSATKIMWILNHVPAIRNLAEKGELAFGTVDSFLLWRLTGGKVHATDATNASRTLLFNLKTQTWDDELLALFNIPKSLLPAVYDSCGDFGHTIPDFLGKPLLVAGIAGDQQAATIGQACFRTGMMKSTYGTGCFMLLNTSNEMISSRNGLITTMAYRINGVGTYGLEGSIFMAGATMQWLRDKLQMISDTEEGERLAIEAQDNQGVYLVPAFTGLGAPYWDPKARGTIVGLTRDSGAAHIVRAALEAVCYQTRDLRDAMYSDGVKPLQALRVDGGMVKNDWLMQFLADILQLPIERAATVEASAQGAAYLAGLGSGLYQSLDEIAAQWQYQRVFTPQMPKEKSQHYYDGWKTAVNRLI
jgi:glycerol kinase